MLVSSCLFNFIPSKPYSIQTTLCFHSIVFKMLDRIRNTLKCMRICKTWNWEWNFFLFSSAIEKTIRWCLATFVHEMEKKSNNFCLQQVFYLYVQCVAWCSCNLEIKCIFSVTIEYSPLEAGEILYESRWENQERNWREWWQ